MLVGRNGDSPLKGVVLKGKPNKAAVFMVRFHVPFHVLLLKHHFLAIAGTQCQAFMSVKAVTKRNVHESVATPVERLFSSCVGSSKPCSLTFSRNSLSTNQLIMQIFKGQTGDFLLLFQNTIFLFSMDTWGAIVFLSWEFGIGMAQHRVSPHLSLALTFHVKRKGLGLRSTRPTQRSSDGRRSEFRAVSCRCHEPTRLRLGSYAARRPNKPRGCWKAKKDFWCWILAPKTLECP